MRHSTALAALAAALAIACQPSSGPALPPTRYAAPLACAGNQVAGFPARLMVGFSGADATAAKPGFDLRYQYLAGGIPDGSGPCTDCRSASCTSAGHRCDNAHGCGWWGCWQYDQDPPGQDVSDFVTAAEADDLLPMFTYYEILQSSGVPEGKPEATDAANDLAFMTRYLADFRFFLQRIGTHPALVHVEPDFWGYAQHAAIDGSTSAAGLPAKVASANPTDCGALPDSIAGLGRCFIAMARNYAPNAWIGLHGSAWASKFDCISNSNPSLDVAAKAATTAAFLSACGAGASDLVVIDIADRDAGYYESTGLDTWLDPTDATLPSFAQAFAWSGALAAGIGKPVLWWQVPLGNMGLPDRPNAWKDNRVDYFFQHPDRVANGGAIGMAFGSGATGQTTPESDGGRFVAWTAALDAVGGQPLCP